jgi:hypothetical protein
LDLTFKAAKNAFLVAYGDDLNIRFCLFHLGQSIHRRIQSEGLVPVYRANEQYRILVRSLAVLSFLNVDLVIHAFQLLRQKASELDDVEENALNIFNYFEK